jgi:hypothetical protein
MQIEKEREEWMTSTEAAAYCRCSKVSLWRRRAEGLVAHRLGGRLLFRRSDIERFILDGSEKLRSSGRS